MQNTLASILKDHYREVGFQDCGDGALFCSHPSGPLIEIYDNYKLPRKRVLSWNAEKQERRYTLRCKELQYVIDFEEPIELRFILNPLLRNIFLKTGKFYTPGDSIKSNL